MKRARAEEETEETEALQTRSQSPSLHQAKVSRRIRACQRCQGRKVKCDIEQGQAKCSRCIRTGSECIWNKSLQSLLENENEWRHDIESQLYTLQATLAELQGKLDAINGAQPAAANALPLPPPPPPPPPPRGPPAGATPGLTHHSADHNTSPNQSLPTPNVTAMTRENSPDTFTESGEAGGPGGAGGHHQGSAKDDRVIVDAPMASLYQITRLRNIRSDPSSSSLQAAHGAGAGGSHRRQEDFIDQGRASLSEAEEFFSTFKSTLNAYLWGGVALGHDTLSSARQSSPLLVAAILAVTALHTQDQGHSFDRYYPILLELAGQSVFQRYHNLDDVRGLCIGAFWLSDVSWKLSGLAVRIATELNIHQSCAAALRDDDEEVGAHFLGARLWYVLYVCDHHFSIAYGRPPVINEDVTITNHESFLDLPGATTADVRLHSQVGIFIILSRADRTFGPDRARLVANDEFEAIRRYDVDIGRWKRKWEKRLEPDPNISNYPARGVILHYHFARLQLFAVCLRGLNPDIHRLITPERKGFINTALKSASASLHLILDDPDIRKAVIGVPLYLLTTIAYASIFLMKVCSKWKANNFEVSSVEVVELIEAIVSLLNDTPDCPRHVNHYIAKGLHSMLEKFRSGETMTQMQVQASILNANQLENSSAGNLNGVLMSSGGGWDLQQQQQQQQHQVQNAAWGSGYNWMSSTSSPGPYMDQQFGIGAEYYYPLDLLGVLGSQMPES